MAQYIDKAALVSEIEKLEKEASERLTRPVERSMRRVTKDKTCIGLCRKILDIIDTLEVRDPYEQCIQYASREDGIKAHAEDYSFNIESELFNQLTKEQQALWRKEIEQAVISGGYSGLNLAKDPRYKENLEVKEVDLKEYYHKFLQKEWFENSHVRTVSEMMAFTAKHFFELGMAAGNKAQKVDKSYG